LRRYASQRQRSHTIAPEITRKRHLGWPDRAKGKHELGKISRPGRTDIKAAAGGLANPKPYRTIGLSAEGSTDGASCKAGSIEAAADKGDATIGSVHARSLLAGLNLDTAIRLRWALRDIRADRTAWSPVSPDDLAALIELGLSEMRNEIPALTYEGRSAID